jgi:hypothetical protein
MELINKSDKKADVRTSLDELLILNNALNEVCNGLDEFEFESRMGVSHAECVELLKKIASIIDNLESLAKH